MNRVRFQRKRSARIARWCMMLSVLVTGAVLFVSGCGGCGQSRSWSRISGKALELELPTDFERPISFTSGREGEKDLFYEATDGKYRVKTYTDSGMWESEIEFVSNEK